MITRLLTLFSLLFTCKLAIAQDPLSIATQNHCLFSGTWEEELYSYTPNPKVKEWVKEICTAGGVEQNFELIQTNVENIAAVYDPNTQKRYILFSQNFTIKANGRQVYMALAHEIGHHANNHVLTEERKTIEEAEADQFMGFVLAKLGNFFSYKDAEKTIETFPSTDTENKKNRQLINENAKIGWNRAQTLQILLNNGEFSSGTENEIFLKAQFPFPPPPCCSPREMPRSAFKNALKMGDVARKLTTALEKQGYFYRTFLSVPNGFALVTQMEQYQVDFTPRTDAARWANAPMNESFMGFMDYFKRLLMPSKANFRTFVFIVTTNKYNLQGDKVSKGEATAWYGRGINNLPKSIADMPYTEGVTVTALVYDFEVPESNKKPNQKCPYVDTQKHLEKSGLWQSITQ